MNSRERIIKALNHEEPDRIPNDLGGTAATSICIQAYKDLIKHIGLKVEEPKIFDVVQQLPVIDQRLMDFFEVDCVPLTPNPPDWWKLEIKDEGRYFTFIDEWGATLRMPKEKGYYFDYWSFPVKSNLEDLKKFKWPDPNNPHRTKGIRDKALKIFNETDYAICCNPLFGGGIFEHPARIMGMEEFYSLLGWDHKTAEYVLEKLCEIYTQAYINILNEVGDLIQVVIYWEDLASQNSLLISPELYRKLIKPREKRIFEAIKNRTKAKLWFHSDGAIYPLIPDLIEIGIDILHPIQVGCNGMGNTAKLKREFGRDISFWGASCEAQTILAFGTPQQVRDETKRRITDLKPGGGYIFSPIHNIQNGVPPENIITMYETLSKYWEY
ncbi:MAG: uroporphyrinogen-III decarboxylase [Actinobacteria bacterium]|nr:uroporphyrinogen-III decarboxylase [Actinomycetota bacterium]